jgi:hypothetical protein
MRRLGLEAVLVALTFVLGACGGGSLTGGTGTGTGGGSGGGGSGGTPATPVPRLGNCSGTTFTAGQIGIADNTLNGGESSALSLCVVDTANGNVPYTGAVDIQLTSSCISSAQSSASPNPISTSTGTATALYTAGSCGGADGITAIANPGGTATGTITVTPSPATSIRFVSATPTTIALQGMGGDTTSEVVFVVTNSSGLPVRNQGVTFSLDTSVGGITLSTASATTGADGQVQTIVNSGSVQTSVRVTARLVDNPATPSANEALVSPAQSSSLVISTGLPDQDSFSLSIGCFNIEGRDYDGTTTSVNIIASDRYNNPVPNGTPITFRAEAGQITSSCLTSGGGCSVQFRSGGTRTADGRVSILATAIGEESFLDNDSNGRFGAGDTLLTDLDDAYVDYDESGTFTAGDLLVDFNGNGSYDGPSTSFTGPLCDANCDSNTSLYVRDRGVIIMSGSTAVISFAPSSFVNVGGTAAFEPAAGDYIDLSNGAVVVAVTVGDVNNQPMPGETTIAGAMNNVGQLSGESSFVQLCTTQNAPSVYTFVLAPVEGHQDTSGAFQVTVTTPKNVKTTATIPVRDSTVPVPPPPPPAPIGSIKFISATPTSIGIRGTGLDETSTVRFQVLSTLGGPVAGETINFALSTSTGGITLDPTSAVSDNSGFVSTIVRSGTVHTSVRVTATSATDPSIVSQSDSLDITTGFPDQNSFSLSLECPNIEGGDIDGTEVAVQLLAADRFNNPVTNGTAVTFTTEGGAIQGSCQTVGGGCSVTWRSQEPRFNGRSTILAYAIGEESFADANGNGRRDAGETFDDIGEAFRDDNESGTYDVGELFFDFDSGGAYDGANGLFTGVLCNAGCDTATKLHVNDSVVVVMSRSTPDIDTSDGTTDIVCAGTGCAGYSGGTFSIQTGALVNLRFIVRDENENPMPQGTTIALTAPVADGGGPVGTSSFVVPCTASQSDVANRRSFAFKAGAVGTSSVLELKVTVPSGLVTTYTFGVDVVP